MDFLSGDVLTTIQEWLAQYGFRLLGASAVFIIGRWAVNWLTGLARKAMGSSNIDKTLTNFAANIIYYVLLAVVVIAALNLIGFTTTSIVAVLGAATLAVGLALQGSLSNFAAGVMLILLGQYKIGDRVEVADTFGIVKEVRIFNTVLTSLDNKRIIIPNSNVISGKIVNYSANDIIRLDLIYGIGYEDDLRKAKAILLDIMQNDEDVLEEPAPSVSVHSLADSSVNLATRPYVKTDDHVKVTFRLNEQVKLRFDEEGISIPFPQMDVHLDQPIGSAAG